MIEVANRDRQARVPEHALHDVRRQLLAQERGVGVAEAVRVHALLDAGLGRQALAELAHVGVAEALAAAGRADHTEVAVSARQAELLPLARPLLEDGGAAGIDRDHAPLIALAVQDRDPAVLEVDVLRVQRERLADPQAGAPHADDQRAVAPASRPAAAGLDQAVHLVGRQHLGRELHALVRRLFAEAIGRLGHGRTIVSPPVDGTVAGEADTGSAHSELRLSAEHGLPPCLVMKALELRSTNRSHGPCGRHCNQWGPAAVVAAPVPCCVWAADAPRSNVHHKGGSGVTGERVVREMRLSTRATHDGTVEVIFLGKVVELDVDQARELQRELTHSIGIATYGRPRIDLHDRLLLERIS